jgi:hypothetical protein
MIMMTDREALEAMLTRAKVEPYQDLSVHRDSRRVYVSTGPDDAAAIFTFSENGELEKIDVPENGWVMWGLGRR